MNITLNEAASLLGVTKETLRNWDKSGKLVSIRDPKNNYRMYSIMDVQALQGSLFDPEPSDSVETLNTPKPGPVLDDESQDRDLKRALTKIHKILRDTDGNSSIIERFDETTKLIFMKLLSEQNAQYAGLFQQSANESLEQFGAKIRAIFQLATTKHPVLFPERFRSINLTNTALVNAAAVLSKVDLSSAKQDIKGFAYEEMIRSTFDKGDHQQFFTPQPIVAFLVEMLGDRLRGSVCDPACGTGGFLVEIAKQGIPSESITGLEIDDRLAWVAGINLLVHGATNFRTKCVANGGSLGALARSHFGEFDAIITNPPFGSDFTDKELGEYKLGQGRASRRRGVLFIERCLDMLREGGTLGIVIDEGVLSLPSTSDVRDLILERAELQAVISLPETAFMPYASVSTSILILRKTLTPSARQLAFYARADNVGRKPNGDPEIEYDDQGSPRLISDLPNIVSTWKWFEKNGTLEKQTDDIYLANPLALTRNVVSGDNRLDFKFHHPARLAAQIGLKDCRFELVDLGAICNIRNESFVPSVDFPDQAIPYTGLAHIESRVGQMQQTVVPGSSLKSGVKKYYFGDILFARMRPALRKVAYVELAKPGYASAECIVLTVKLGESGEPVIDPFLLSVLLRSDYTFGQLIHLIAGIGRPRIGSKDLLKVKIPMPDKSRQGAFKDAFLKIKEHYESLLIEARKLAETAKTMELQAIESVADSFIGKNEG